MICAFFKSPYNSTNNFDDTPVTLQNDKILKDKSLGFIFPILKCSTKTVRIIYSAIIQVVFLASKTFFQRSALQLDAASSAERFGSHFCP